MVAGAGKALGHAGQHACHRVAVGLGNDDAHKVLQAVCTSLSSLSRQLGELLADAKKPSSEIISNLKVLMMSSRNRDNTNFLEANYANWNIFFEIMKNYVIINTGDIKHE